MTHTTFLQSNLSVSSTVVNPLVSSMSRRARESFAASASAKQKPVHCTAIARTINDKNADMDSHAVHAPDYKAGGGSQREELCQQDHEDFQRMAMNNSFPRTQDLIQSVQRQVQRCIHSAGITGLGHISFVKNCIAQ